MSCFTYYLRGLTLLGALKKLVYLKYLPFRPFLPSLITKDFPFSLLHIILGFGVPVALHVNKTSEPSLTVVSELVSPVRISGETICK